MNDEKLRKIHSLERLKRNLDDLSLKQVRNLCGFVEPDANGNWEVSLMFEGEGMTCETQEHAEIISTQEQILSLMIQKECKYADTEHAQNADEKQWVL